MKKKSETTDELRPEYDFRSMKVVQVGPGRQHGASTVTLDADVAEMFPTSASVNEALRFLMRTAKRTKAKSAKPLSKKTQPKQGDDTGRLKKLTTDFTTGKDASGKPR